MDKKPSGFRIGRMFGIDMYVQPSWFLIFGVLVWSNMAELGRQFGTSGVTSLNVGFAVLAASALFASVLAHEYGHALMARFFGYRTLQISLHLFGGVAEIDAQPRRPRDEFWVAVAGPLVSLALAFVFGVFAAVVGLATNKGQSSLLGAYTLDALVSLAFVNGMLFLFNLLPGYPMDGGRVLRSIVWASTGNALGSIRIAATAGRVIGGALMAIGVVFALTGNFAGLWFVLVGWFLHGLAKASYQHAEFQALFDGYAVRDLMRPVLAVIPADATLGEAKQLFFDRLAMDQFPVVRGERLAGYIDRTALGSVEPRQLEWTRVEERTVPFDLESTLAPEQEGFLGFVALVQRNLQSLPVFAGRKLVGYLRREDVLHFMDQRRRAVG